MKANTAAAAANSKTVPPTTDPSIAKDLRSASSAANSIPGDPSLTEDAALAFLQQPELTASALEQLARTAHLLKSRKVRIALLTHPRTPRHISLPLLRQLYTFDLMQIALTPAVAGDLKRAADEALCNRMTTISSGERLALARRGSGRVAVALLQDKETRVMRTALENARLTEAHIIQAITRAGSNTALIETLCHHSQWSLRREVRIALLRHEKTPLGRAIDFARGLPPAQLREILQNSRLPENIKAYLVRDLNQRRRGASAG